MNKVVFECVGNSIMFALSSLFIVALITVGYVSSEVAIMWLIFFVAGVVYLVLRSVLIVKRKEKLTALMSCIELAKSDEREVRISNRASKTAYFVAMHSMSWIVIAIAVFACFFPYAFNLSILSIVLITFGLILTTCAYCIRWVIEYKK